MEVGDVVSAVGELRQGDIVSLTEMPDGTGGVLPAPLGVVILTQTCDVIQPSKTFCTVAVVQSAEKDLLSRARRGQAPLMLFLPEVDENPAQVADMERMASVPKATLVGTRLIGRRTRTEQAVIGRNIAARIGRVFNRFPFPDAIHVAFRRLQKKAQAAGAESAFGGVLDRVLELRLSTIDWSVASPPLTLHVVVPDTVLIPAEDADDEWIWDPESTHGAKRGESLSSMKLTRLSELLLASLEAEESAPESVDLTTLLRLWEAWAAALRAELLQPSVHDGTVSAFELSLVSDAEFTLADFNRSESLDLEVLSDSTA